MCLRYFLVLLKHCQHERAYTSKITKNKKGGGHQSAPNVPDCLIELFPDIGIDKQESARLSINHHKSCFYCRSPKPNAGKWAIEHTWSRLSPGWTPGWTLAAGSSSAGDCKPPSAQIHIINRVKSLCSWSNPRRLARHFVRDYAIPSRQDWQSLCLTVLYRIRPGLTKILPCAPWSGCGSQCPTSFSCNVLVDMGAMHNEHVLHANITFLFFCIPCFLLQWKEQGNDQSPTMLIFHPPLCRWINQGL